MTKLQLNNLSLTKSDYAGADSTLCKGCGHNSITNQIIATCYELGLQPEKLIKLSGIGCSSKSPAYFLNRSHGFNAAHGRMPSVATGALLANSSLRGVGVSGDGDTASIGLGQFKHLLRRNVPLVYIVENNGVYGLTKGQFSATAQSGSRTKHAGYNPLSEIDLVLEAIISGCGFVARSFAGDRQQVVSLLKAALCHKGTAMLDIISPCVAFNNEWWDRDYVSIHDIDFIPTKEEIIVDYEPGETQTIELHDSSQLVLKKIDNDHDPTDRMAAIRLAQEAREDGKVVTGLIYYNPQLPDLRETLSVPPTPLVHLPPEKLRPSRQSLATLMAEFA